MKQPGKREYTDPYSLMKFMIIGLTGWVFLCTACVSIPQSSNQPVENDLMEMIILYENIMPNIFNNEFYFDDHNRKYFDVQYRKLERVTDDLSSQLEKRPKYIKTGFYKQDPAIYLALKPIVENLTIAITAYRTGHLQSSQNALKNTIESVVAITESPAIGKLRRYVKADEQSKKIENMSGTEGKDIDKALTAMKLAKYNLLSNEFGSKIKMELRKIDPQRKAVKPGLAQFQEKGSVLHEKLNAAQDTDERVRSMYELGQFYADNNQYDNKGLASIYLQSCILLTPGSSLAGKCYAALQRHMFSKASNKGFAMGSELDQQDRALLEDMKILSRPRVMSVGMVGGLENFY